MISPISPKKLFLKRGTWSASKALYPFYPLILYVLAKCGPTTGPWAACGPPRRFQWPRNHSGKIFKSEICWKACEVTFVSL